MPTAFRSAQTTFTFFSRTLSYIRRSKREDADLESLKTNWAEATLLSFGINVRTMGEPAIEGPLILVGNHISYLDIPLLMMVNSGVSFLAKNEISKWPIVGQGARAMKTTFVKRGDKNDRAFVRRQIAESLKEKIKIAIFPSGTTSLDDSKPWKRGAFEIAESLGVPIQPFRIHYSPLRTAAFIDQDFFFAHLYSLAKTARTDAFIEFHPPVMVKNAAESSEHWRKWAAALKDV